ncbi:olfactory receptor 10A2-like [Pleurodeles waltl]|uniref:olfactory receptor 10A2-like n=1 Tax=Pleurodeles waltl TaxID=8319 RepID=UPI0037096232
MSISARNDTQSSVTHFILVGFSDMSTAHQGWLSALFLCIYLLTIIWNTIMILLVTFDPLLQTTMYLFLRNLSFLEICYSSTTLPKLLIIFFLGVKYISFVGCAFQMYFFFSVGVTECFLLAFMSYDRYVAICIPLRYPTIMTKSMCNSLTAVSFMGGFFESLVQTGYIFSLPYCDFNIINHFFCDIPSVLRLACTNTFNNEVFFWACTVVFAVIPFMLVLSSYVQILLSILRIQSISGRYKAFCTCSSHLTSVILFYGTGTFTYLRPRSSHSPKRDKLLALLYSIMTPMMNPLIYSLRNQEVQASLMKIMSLRKRE